MEKTVRCALAGAIAVFASGCATVPDVTLSYYRTKWNAQVTVTQTVGCKTETKQLYALSALTVLPTYSSDTNNSSKLRIKSLDGGFSDSDLTMTFTDDGRLKSINQSTTGQGEAIIKSAVALTAALEGMKILALDGAIDPCDFLTQTFKDKPVTLTYRATIDQTTLNELPRLLPTQDSEYVYRKIERGLPVLSIRIGKTTDNVGGPSYGGLTEESGNVVLLELQKTKFVEVSVEVSRTNPPSEEILGPVRITAPQETTYKLPIPKGAFFGKQAFSVTLSDSGAVLSVGYNKTSGVAGALNAAGAIAATDTAATKAAELKAQADLIYQQQRLILCQTKPDQCK